jgi:hypothetical protein
MASNLDHWYPPATVTRNKDKDCWEYRVGKDSSQLIVNRGSQLVHMFFQTQIEAILFAEDELKNHQISKMTIYGKNGDISVSKKSRLHKAIQEYKDEAVAEYEQECFHMKKHYESKLLELSEKAAKWDELQKLMSTEESTS